MRVLHLLDTTEDYAGTEIHLTTLVRAQLAQGVEAQIACVAGGLLHRAAVSQDLPFLLLPPGNPLRQASAFRAATRGQFDILHAHNGRTRLLAALAARAPVAVVATQHFITPQSALYSGAKKRLANRAHRIVNARVARYIAISLAARDAMIEREGVSAAKISLVANGIEPIAAPDATQKARLRSELGLSADAHLIVCAARLRVEKGLNFLIKAMPAVVAAQAQARLAIAGDGDLQDELEALAARLGVSHAVQFLGYRDDAIALIGAADVFVLPSPAEPFGLVIIEAMSQGIPCVATCAGGPLEIIEDGVSGLLVEPENAASLASALIDLLADPAKRVAMGAQALKQFGARFTAQRMAAATLEVYRIASNR